METVTKPNRTIPTVPKHGQGLRALVEARQRELELELIEVQKGGAEKGGDIEAALSALKALLTGNLDQIPPVLAQDLSRWIETSRFLGATTEVTKTEPAPSMVPKSGADLRAFVEARHRQHEVQLNEIKRGASGQIADIEIALNSLKSLLTGDLDKIPPVVAQELGKWIETNEHLGGKPRHSA